MHVGIITYQTGHLKTFQLMLKLMTAGHRITLYAFPFTLRPQTQTRFCDRPFQLLDLDVPEFCRRHGVRYLPVAGWQEEHAGALGLHGDPAAPEVFLTCIAKIIPAPFIKGRTILNCHPGLLPHNRGVDAFKWCLVNEWPIGITLHVIDEAIDRGIILDRIRVPVLPGDTLAELCQRAYDMELDLMAAFQRYLPNLAKNWRVDDGYQLSRKLIPSELDACIEPLFLEKRPRLVELSSDFAAQSHPADANHYKKENAWI